MKRIISLSMVLLFTLFSCEKDDVKRGDLNVRVYLNGYYPVNNAQVFTKPSSETGITDEFGSVLLNGLKTGSYEVFGYVEGVGSGKAVANIKENELTETTINIIEGTFTGLAPTISITSPEYPAEFTENDTILFRAEIEDDETAPQNINIEWKSDLDGVLYTGHPGNDGISSFTTSTLSRGIHNITLTATDDDDYSSGESISVSTLAIEGITLFVPTIIDGKVVLEWSQYTGNDFQKYEVFRSDGYCNEGNEELINTITAIGTTTFSDATFPFEYQACYHIRVTNNVNNFRNSNNELVNLPSGHLFNFEAYDMLKHPTQNYIYLLDRGGQKIVKFDYIQMEVVDQVNLQGNIGFCDIGENGFGVEIYAPSSDGWIYVYNADNLDPTIQINTGLSTPCVVINGLGHVIASVLPSPWWEQPIRTYSRSTGINIDGNGDFEGDRLRMIPGKNELISISTQVSPVDMEYFQLDANGLIVLHQDDQYHGDYPLNPYIFRISDNGVYSITSSSGAVYLANGSMEYKGQLQHGTLEFSDYAFSEDGSIIYAATSNRKSIQIGHYPSLIRDDEILTKGFPLFIIRDGNKIISLSKASESSFNSGIEIIDLDK